MKCCKFAIRNNLYYPVMLIIFIVLRRIDVALMKSCEYENGVYIGPALIFISQILAGLIPILIFRYKTKNIPKNKKFLGIELIQTTEGLIQPDKNIKIAILMILASYFNFIGVIVRKLFSYQKNINFPPKAKYYENLFRSAQIEISALLFNLTIKIKIYKHQRLSLIIIFIFSIIILITDILDSWGNLINTFIYIGLSIFSSFSRAFLDTIEKYLFEVDFINPYVVLMIEGIFGTLVNQILFLVSDNYSKDIKEIISIKKDKLTFSFLIILLIFYSVFSLFKNIYRVHTIKYYSPMTRALAESIIDPIIIIYYLIDEKIDIFDENYNIEINLSYYIIIIFSLFINAICSFIYNDFIICYCFGLEHNTYSEIKNRSISEKKAEDNFYEEEDNSDEEDDPHKKNELSSINK